tara:strand:+ start:4798 stop:5424 length:627 start_codon:yes stop_codon:yes gene_type:complete
MEQSDELTINLFLSQKEQEHHLQVHGPPRLRPVGWNSLNELCATDRNELLFVAHQVKDFESSHKASMLMAIGAEIILNCKGELITLTEQYTDRSFILMDVAAYSSHLEDSGKEKPSSEEMLLIHEWVAMSPYKLYVMANKLNSAIDTFIEDSYLLIASGRGFIRDQERNLNSIWEEQVLDWAENKKEDVRKGILSYVPNPFEDMFTSF